MKKVLLLAVMFGVLSSQQESRDSTSQPAKRYGLYASVSAAIALVSGFVAVYNAQVYDYYVHKLHTLKRFLIQDVKAVLYADTLRDLDSNSLFESLITIQGEGHDRIVNKDLLVKWHEAKERLLKLAHKKQHTCSNALFFGTLGIMAYYTGNWLHDLYVAWQEKKAACNKIA